MDISKKYISRNELIEYLSVSSNEFAVVNNPAGVYPEYDFYPLANKLLNGTDSLEAVLMDMDGTLTTTEELCLHSLEFMVRKMSGRMSTAEWNGLDHTLDYPNIIGNSTTKHVEFLIEKYSDYFIQDEIIKSFIYSVLWTIILGHDKGRKKEVIVSLKYFGIPQLTEDEKFLELCSKETKDNDLITYSLDYFVNKYKSLISEINFTALVRAGIDIYYQRYHEILEMIKNGEGDWISKQLLGSDNKHLIEPMPGVEIFLPMVKGLLSGLDDKLFDLLIESYRIKASENYTDDVVKAKENFKYLCHAFLDKPLKLSVSTSSILYEAEIVLKEMFKVIHEKISHWNIPGNNKNIILEKMKDYRKFFDSIVTASDSNEIRLKPHRDLYSISLVNLGIPIDKFSNVVGFEDSESGITAQRAAGIGLAIAVPFNKTQGHNLEAATFILNGGLPEAILKHKLFITSE